MNFLISHISRKPPIKVCSLLSPLLSLRFPLLSFLDPLSSLLSILSSLLSPLLSSFISFFILCVMYLCTVCLCQFSCSFLCALLQVGERRRVHSTCKSCDRDPGLSSSNTHYLERDFCMNMLTAVYGYIPLLHTQFRVEPILSSHTDTSGITAGERHCFESL